MNDSLIQKTTAFSETFGKAPEKIVLSPGRITSLENIDYNDGFVLPAAIDKIICCFF
jgi:galactokinase